jgi:hypothetical protein
MKMDAVTTISGVKARNMLHWGSRISRNFGRGASGGSQYHGKLVRFVRNAQPGTRPWMKLCKKLIRGAHGEEPVAVVRTS